MGSGIMYIVEIELCREFRVGGACKEVEAAVLSQNAVSQLYHRSNGSKAQNIIITGSVRKVHHAFLLIFNLACVHIDQLNSLFRRFFRGKDLLCPGKACVVNIRYN